MHPAAGAAVLVALGIGCGLVLSPLLRQGALPSIVDGHGGAPATAAGWLMDESNVRLPRDANGEALPIADRLRLLELKVGGFTNWAKDPWFGQRVSARGEAGCKAWSDLEVYGCSPKKQTCPGLYSHAVCLDRLPAPVPYNQTAPLRPDCVVYDFGIRKNPEFGLVRHLAQRFPLLPRSAGMPNDLL